MNIEDLLDELDEVLDNSTGFFGGRSIIVTDKVRAILDDIRLNLPQEIKQANNVLNDRNDIVSNAKREAESIIKSAEERARALVAQEEITRLAQARATEMINAANAKTQEMRRAAQEFVDDLMSKVDESLMTNLNDLRKTRSALRQQRQVSAISPKAASNGQK